MHRLLLALFALGGALAFAVAPSVRSAEAQVGATQYVWTSVDPISGHTLRVDPFSKSFELAPRNQPAVAATVPSMQVSKRRVTWKWQDLTRTCPPKADGTVPRTRCPIFVWATLDRVRNTVRATLFQRTTTGRVTYSVNVNSANLKLPRPDDPEKLPQDYRLHVISIQDFNFVPRTTILLNQTDRVAFLNETNFEHTVLLDRAPTNDATICRDLVRCATVGLIRPGKFTDPYPFVRAPTLPPGETAPPPPKVWSPGTYRFFSEEYPFMTGFVVVRE